MSQKQPNPPTPHEMRAILNQACTEFLTKEYASFLTWVPAQKQAELVTAVAATMDIPVDDVEPVYVEGTEGDDDDPPMTADEVKLMELAQEIFEMEGHNLTQDQYGQRMEQIYEEAAQEQQLKVRMLGIDLMKEVFGEPEAGTTFIAGGGGFKNPDGTWTDFKF